MAVSTHRAFKKAPLVVLTLLSVGAMGLHAQDLTTPNTQLLDLFNPDPADAHHFKLD